MPLLPKNISKSQQPQLSKQSRQPAYDPFGLHTQNGMQNNNNNNNNIANYAFSRFTTVTPDCLTAADFNNNNNNTHNISSTLSSVMLVNSPVPKSSAIHNNNNSNLTAFNSPRLSSIGRGVHSATTTPRKSSAYHAIVAEHKSLPKNNNNQHYGNMYSVSRHVVDPAEASEQGLLTSSESHRDTNSNSSKYYYHVAGNLVCDSLLPKSPHDQLCQANEISNFKMNVCTSPSRRAALLFQKQSENNNTSNSTMHVPSPPRNGNNNNKSLSHQVLEQNQKLHLDFVNTQLENFVMSFASEQQKHNRRRRDYEKEKAKQQRAFLLNNSKQQQAFQNQSLLSNSGQEPSSLTSPTKSSNPASTTTIENNKSKPGNSNNNSKQQQTAGNQITGASSSSAVTATATTSHHIADDNDDSDDRSSTDSAIIDPAVVSAAVARNTQRRATRLRDHFSASLDTLNQTAGHASSLVLNSAAVVSSASGRGGRRNQIPSAGSAGDGPGDSSCVLMSYLVGLERLVEFAFNTLGSKDELAAVVNAVSGLGGLAETASSFGRWTCFTRDSLSYRLENILPVAFDRRALFDAFAGVLRDGRVIHAVLLSGLRLLYFSPSPAHFLEFILTVMFVHQTPMSQSDCQTLDRLLTNPHPLRFLVRGRKDNAVFSGTNNNNNEDGDAGTKKSSVKSKNANHRSRQDFFGTALHSAAVDVDRAVAGEELYFLLEYLSTATPSVLGGGCTVTWADLQRLVAPAVGPDETQLLQSSKLAEATGGGGGSDKNNSGKTLSTSVAKNALNSNNNNNNGKTNSKRSGNAATAANDNITTGSGEEKPLSSTEKEEERKREAQSIMLRKHETALELKRREGMGDVFAGNSKKKDLHDCVIIARLMSEMKNP